jgi:hypothetical protein
MDMTNYNIEKIEGGIATLRYADNSWAELVLSADMTEADLDDLALQFAPKTGVAPSFATVGFTSTASAKPEPIGEEEEEPEEYVDNRPAWLIARQTAYGTLESQLEYITENGLDAWQTHVAEIKAANPKT